MRPFWWTPFLLQCQSQLQNPSLVSVFWAVCWQLILEGKRRRILVTANVTEGPSTQKRRKRTRYRVEFDELNIEFIFC